MCPARQCEAQNTAIAGLSRAFATQPWPSRACQALRFPLLQSTNIAATRIMRPYHGSLSGDENSKADQELELEVLTLFGAGLLPLTLGKVMELRQLMTVHGYHEIFPMYQHPADVKV